jgi:hypothetical protein
MLPIMTMYSFPVPTRRIQRQGRNTGADSRGKALHISNISIRRSRNNHRQAPAAILPVLTV